MNINELEAMLDREVAEDRASIIESTPVDRIDDNSVPSGITTASPSELLPILARITRGEMALVGMGDIDNDGVAVATLQDNEGTRTVYLVNSVWRSSIMEVAEAYAAQNGAAVSPNSPTLEMDATTSRFSGAVWYEKIQQQEIILAGIGGIGSWVALLLGRMKPARLIMYDPDKVESVNMSGQLYSSNDVGEYKVEAMRNKLALYCNYMADVYAQVYADNSAVRPIMICGFDNMAARKLFYYKWKREVLAHVNKDEYLFIDGRLAAEEYQVFAIQGDDEEAMKRYEDRWLFSDEEAEETICSYKQTSFMANMIASTMVNIFVNFVANMCNPLFPREVPFFTSYDASTMLLKAKYNAKV